MRNLMTEAGRAAVLRQFRVRDAGLPTRVASALAYEFKTLDDIDRLTNAELLRVPYFGVKGLRLVRAAIEDALANAPPAGTSLSGVDVLIDGVRFLPASVVEEFGSSRVRDRIAAKVGCNHDLLHDALQAEVAAALRKARGED